MEREEQEKASSKGEENEEIQAPLQLDAEALEALEKLILNTPINKYDAILLARRWAYELRNKDHETRSIQELIPQAIKDILGARISQKMVRDLPVLRVFPKKGKGGVSPGALDNIGKSGSSSNPERGDGKSVENPSKGKS